MNLSHRGRARLSTYKHQCESLHEAPRLHISGKVFVAKMEN